MSYNELPTESDAFRCRSVLAMSTIDDSDASFVYTPQSEWSINDQDIFINNTLQCVLDVSVVTGADTLHLFLAILRALAPVRL